MVARGMRMPVLGGTCRKANLGDIEVAGKTGTAQESRTRGNHAFFISYGPYTNPEICVTVNIPYGYSSSNAAAVAKNIYRFYLKIARTMSSFAHKYWNERNIRRKCAINKLND